MLSTAIRRTRRTASFSRPYSSLFIQQSFTRNALYVLDVGRRLFKFSAIGLVVLGSTAATAYEALHQYVEHVELAPDADQDTRNWEWHQHPQPCHWSIDHVRGGTDSSLGFRGRHAVRAAWMAYNWGVGFSTAVVDSDAKHSEGLPGPGGIRVLDAGLQTTDGFLRSAIRIAEEKRVSGSLNPHTFSDLLLSRAFVLERLGGSFRAEAKSEYERAWPLLTPQESNLAHVAWRLGDLSSQSGKANDALTWWSRAIQLSCGKPSEERKQQDPIVPAIPPTSPQAQRTLTSTLISLSAFYATSGQLKKAQEVEESALSLIRSIPPPESQASATPAQALHALYLLHRSSLLSIHLAEVLHAQKQPIPASLQWLTAAAESSERVVYGLIGIPMDNFHNRYPVSQAKNRPLLNTFQSSRSADKIATSLIRDARRSAAEAWNLMGVLHESREGCTSYKARECYQRAIEWASITLPQSETKVAADGMLEADWEVIRSNYDRLQRCAEQNKLNSI